MEALSASVVSQLRSGASVPSVSHCAEELVQNAVDSGATCIAVRVDLALHKVQVIDNGSGINKRDLAKIGTRHMTSKGLTESKLNSGKTFKYYGYRGEALANLRHVSGILQIISKATNDQKTWSTMFARGVRRPVDEYYQKRQSSGTTVTVVDLMYNLPVRKNRVNPVLDLEQIRTVVAAIAVANPTISFTLRDETKGTKVLQTNRANTAHRVFQAVFGAGNSTQADWTLKDLEHLSDKYTLRGFVALEGSPNKESQLLYVKRRFVRNSKLLKVVNNSFKKSVICRQVPAKFFNKTSGAINETSPSKLRKVYPVFYLSLECPFKEVDMSFEPRKTEVEFADWTAVVQFLEEAVHTFLKNNRLLVPAACINDDTDTNSVDADSAAAGCHLQGLSMITGIAPLDDPEAVGKVKEEGFPQSTKTRESSADRQKRRTKNLYENVRSDLITGARQGLAIKRYSGTKNDRQQSREIPADVGNPATFDSPKYTSTPMKSPSAAGPSSLFGFGPTRHAEMLSKRHRSQAPNSNASDIEERTRPPEKPISIQLMKERFQVPKTRSLQPPKAPSPKPQPVERRKTSPCDRGNLSSVSSIGSPFHFPLPDTGKALKNPFASSHVSAASSKLQRLRERMSPSASGSNIPVEPEDINSRFTEPIEERLFQSGTKPSTSQQGMIGDSLSHRRMSAMGSQMVQSHSWNLGNQECGYEQIKSGSKVNFSHYEKQGNAREPPYLDRSSHERVEDKLLQSLSNESIAKQQTSKAEIASQRLPSSVGSNRAFQHDAWNLYPSPQIGGVDDYQVGGGFCSEEDEEEQVLAMWAKNQRTEKTLNMTGLFNLSQVNEHQSSTSGLSTTNAGRRLPSFSTDTDTSGVFSMKTSGGMSSPQPPSKRHRSLSPPLESNTGFIPQTDPTPLQSPKQLPKGWVECKDSTTGKPVYVHLASGTAVTSLKDLPGVRTTSETRDEPKSRQLWPLPSGKSPFMPTHDKRTHDRQSNTGRRIDEDEELRTAKWGRPVTAEMEWTNPVFGVPQRDPKTPTNVNQLAKHFGGDVATREHHVNFKHDLFDKLTLVGQVDKKFIAMSMNKNLDSSADNPDKELLLLFDQHAVHERVRIEQLLEEHYPDKSSVISTEISAIEITLGGSDLRIVKSHLDQFAKFGLEFEDEEEICDSDKSSESVKLKVIKVPTCFVMREDNDLLNYRPSPLLKLCRWLIEDIVAALRETRCVGVLPKTLNYVLNSRACRGAVKFGDSLSREKCRELMRQLSQCQLPFQCAHGRPSIAPIVSINQLRLSTPNPPKVRKLNFSKLRNR